MKYRAEIDGLRALAVLPVILFHADASGFSGGYTGVDVFFVISGYLITGIIIKNIDEEKFSISDFYERRIRRIFPSLFFISLICIPISAYSMSPTQFKDFMQSILSISIFSSNILFYKERGYFNQSTEEIPLIHTWSLSVEEQFYIAFPLLLIFVKNSRISRIALVGLIALSSFLLSEWLQRVDSFANFYLLPTRAWELAAGSFCAIIIHRVPDLHVGLRTALGALGLVFIGAGICLLGPETPFPSAYALLPVGGTCLIVLFCGRNDWIGRLLSLAPFTLLGQASYSIYLVHQPLFAFSRLMFSDETWFLLALGAASLGLGVVLWRYVERPFRSPGSTLYLQGTRLFATAGSIMTVFLAAGFMGHVFDGFPSRTAPNGIAWNDLALDQRLAPNYGLNASCDLTTSNFGAAEIDECMTREAPQVLVWGDSYAMHLVPALQSNGVSERLGLLQLTRSQCPPILGLGREGTVISAEECLQFNENVMALLRETQSIRYVVMSSPYRVRGTVIDGNGVQVDNRDNSYAESRILATANAVAAAGAVPIFVGPPPADGSNLGRCLGNAYARSRPLETCNFAEEDIDRRIVEAYELLDNVSNSYSVIDLRNELCREDRCLVTDDGIFLYRDSGHLSFEGSRHLGLRYGLLTEISELEASQPR
jgi:peptidoglycan/LPS O-acetylase OafA/YrhL